MSRDNEAAARVPPEPKPGMFSTPERPVQAAIALVLVVSLVALTGLGIDCGEVGTLAGIAVTFYFTKRNGSTKPSGG